MRKYTIFFLFLTSMCFYAFGQKQTVSLLFAGDAMQHQSQIDAAKTKDGYDYSFYFKQIEDQIKAADIAIVNLETTLPGKGYTGYPCFGSPDAFAYALKDAGFDVFLTANNHSLDKRKQGLERTITMLDSMHVKHLGTYIDQDKKDLYYPLMIIKNGIRIAMLNYTYDTNGIQIQKPNVINLIDKKQILHDIQWAKMMKPDIIIANMHWGIEHKLSPSKEQKELAQFLIKNGVRLVIGSHPHVVQPIDIQRQSDSIQNIIVYSLGNFISGMKGDNVEGGMMAKIDLSKDNEGIVRIENCSYSLVWVNKPIENGKPNFQLIPVEKYQNEEGKLKLGEESYHKMIRFSDTSKKTIESLWGITEDK